MKNKLHLEVRTQGVKGGNFRYEKKGKVTIFASDNGNSRSDLIIDVDQFTGFGSSYSERKNLSINIEFQHELIFRGTIDEFIEKLKKD